MTRHLAVLRHVAHPSMENRFCFERHRSFDGPVLAIACEVRSKEASLISLPCCLSSTATTAGNIRHSCILSFRYVCCPHFQWSRAFRLSRHAGGRRFVTHR